MTLSNQVGPWKHDVFLSFRGEDTRKGFTDHLYQKLQAQGIETFRDDPRLERGTTISRELLSAIEQSRFAIVVLSTNYATSRWCLLELSKIVACMGERGTILPIFYEVEPSDVRHQRGSFAQAFEEHEEKFGEGNKEVEGWRDALTKVANLAGWSSKDYRYETDLIREIVQTLWSHPSLIEKLFISSEHFTSLTTLSLNDCNLCEGDIPNEIGSLSSLTRLELRGNNFISLPGIHLLSKLEHIDVADCRRLEQLILPVTDEDLSGNPSLWVTTNNCNSLQAFPVPPDLGRLWLFRLDSINCLSAASKQDAFANYFIHSMLKWWLLEVPGWLKRARNCWSTCVIPGSEIPKCLNNQSVGNSVTVKSSSNACDSKLIGVVYCALIAPQHNPSPIPPKCPAEPIGIDLIKFIGPAVEDIVSEHLYFYCMKHDSLGPTGDLNDVPPLEFTFFPPRCVEVKKCGSRLFYERDVEELRSIMKQSNSNHYLPMEELINCDIGESAYQQGGVIVKATQEAATSGNGASDDEYYSAEE